jgi:hypothetical protein
MSVAAPRYRAYHERHAYEMMGALRDLRFEVVQEQRKLDRQGVSSGDTAVMELHPMALDRDARVLSDARRDLENAILSLRERDYSAVYPYLDRASGELELTPYDSLGDSIREWRDKWLPNKGLNTGRS